MELSSLRGIQSKLANVVPHSLTRFSLGVSISLSPASRNISVHLHLYIRLTMCARIHVCVPLLPTSFLFISIRIVENGNNDFNNTSEYVLL